MDKYYVVVVGDTNDADYISEMTVLDLSERDITYYKSFFKKIAEVIKDERQNWPMSQWFNDDPYKLYQGKLDETDIAHFMEFCPYGEDGIHTVKSINIYKVTEEIQIL